MARKVGDVILEYNGQEHDVISISYDDETGRKTLDLMTKTGNEVHHFRANAKLTGEFEVVIPGLGTEPAWRDIEDARLVVVDPHGLFREAIDDVGVEKVSSKYQNGEHAVRTISFFGKIAATGPLA